MTNEQAFMAGGIVVILLVLTFWVWITDQKNEALNEKNVQLERDQSYEEAKAAAEKLDPKTLQSDLDSELDDIGKPKS